MSDTREADLGLLGRAARIGTVLTRYGLGERGAADVPLEERAKSLRAALEELERNHPSLYCNICDETGTVRRHLNVFVNASHVRDRGGLDTTLAPGDVVTILAAVSGG